MASRFVQAPSASAVTVRIMSIILSLAILISATTPAARNTVLLSMRAQIAQWTPRRVFTWLMALTILLARSTLQKAMIMQTVTAAETATSLTGQVTVLAFQIPFAAEQ